MAVELELHLGTIQAGFSASSISGEELFSLSWKTDDWIC